jgi:glutamyl-tRNA synthetase
MPLNAFPKVKTRIAPSPTGNLHLGTVRTALYNVLFAKKHQGEFFFRLEDTDRQRSEEQFTQEILEGFKWLNVSWDTPGGRVTEQTSSRLRRTNDRSVLQVHEDHEDDENAEIGVPLHAPETLVGLGEDGIVRQSLREAVHSSYIERLINEGKAYRCFATVEELDAMREAQKARKEIERYDNRSRTVSKDDSEKLLSEGKPHVVRLNLGADHVITWLDLIRGEVSINTKDLGGDPVIQKSTGQVLYNFAVVIDDYEMQISHILRGEDHISNTAKQIAIYEALGFPIPEFGHLPLIFTKDKQKLSKRKHGDIASVNTYKTQGYLAKALVNYLLGTSYNSAKYGEIFTIPEAAEDFQITSVSKSPAIYDIQKLNWYNRDYISKLNYEEILTYVSRFSRFDLENNSLFNSSQIQLIIESIQESLDKFEQIDEHINYFFEDFKLDDSALVTIAEEGKEVIHEFISLIESGSLDFADQNSIKNGINSIGEKLNLKGKKLFFPIRVAISAKTSGPELGFIAVLLGKEKIIERLNSALLETSHQN